MQVWLKNKTRLLGARYNRACSLFLCNRPDDVKHMMKAVFQPLRVKVIAAGKHLYGNTEFGMTNSRN